jgi:hypothetical protein
MEFYHFEEVPPNIADQVITHGAKSK